MDLADVLRDGARMLIQWIWLMYVGTALGSNSPTAMDLADVLRDGTRKQ